MVGVCLIYAVSAALHGQNLSELAEKVTALEPSELSFVDGETLGLLEQKVGDTSWKKFSDNLPSAMIFVEFDDKKSSKKTKKMARILEDFGIEDVKMASEFEDQESLRSMRDSVRAVANFNERGVVAPSIGTDLLVQPSRIPEFVEKIRAIFAKHHLDGGIWGDLASGRITAQPLLNPVNLGQKQSLIKLIPDLRAAANDYSAPATNQIANGRLGSLFISDLYDKDALKIFTDVKTTFDPFGILNPGVKFGLDNEELLRSIKRDFTHDRFLEF
jgi:FAD/FMN-containing dehydrogenase